MQTDVEFARFSYENLPYYLGRCAVLPMKNSCVIQQDVEFSKRVLQMGMTSEIEIP